MWALAKDKMIHYLSIWMCTDYVVFGYLLSIVGLFILDSRIHLSNRMSAYIGFSPETIMLLFSVLTTGIFVYFDSVFKYLTYFFSIVDYFDVKDQFLRNDTIKAMLFTYMTRLIISPIASGIIAKMSGLSVFKWVTYNFVMNWLGLYWLMSSKKESAANKYLNTDGKF
jgi:hypothetical protein